MAIYIVILSLFLRTGDDPDAIASIDLELIIHKEGNKMKKVEWLLHTMDTVDQLLMQEMMIAAIISIIIYCGFEHLQACQMNHVPSLTK